MIEQKGIILLVTILMITTISLLVLSLFRSVFLYTKLTNQFEVKHKERHELDTLASKRFSMNPDCIVLENEPNKVIDLLKSGQGCKWTEGKQSYHYIISDLGVYPCLRILSNKKILSSHHWLITISTKLKRNIVQLRMASPEISLPCKVSKEIQLNERLLSWRYL